jgi:hypothetical protein
MAKGISMHIGLNSVDPNHYGGWDGKLNACENDAIDLELIAKSMGFGTSLLLTKQATRNSVINQIQKTAGTLKSGDIFFISYSGHGGQLPDISGDEGDQLDETWCLFDSEFVDDELFELWTAFAENVRILVFSDSCHSGTVTKVVQNRQALFTNKLPAYKCMPSDVALRTYIQNKSFYDKILTKDKKEESRISASVKLISGCQDNQLSSDGTFNGLFTGILKQVWNGGGFKGDYSKYHKQIVQNMPPDQTPKLFDIGSVNNLFNSQRPFTI